MSTPTKREEVNQQKTRPTVARVLAASAGKLTGLSAEQLKVVKDLTRCRTEALGGQLYGCEKCGHQEPRYHSCRNRHCPLCQALARNAWLEARKKELFPGPYFHVVFTVPDTLHELFLRNKEKCYKALFKAVSRTLLQVGKRRLGGQMGFMAILHTWNQQLGHHPHVHCVVPGGALKSDPDEWVASGEEYLFPVRVLSEVFRGKVLSLLEHAFAKGRLVFPGKIASLEKAGEFVALLRAAASTSWVVYAKPTLDDPVQLLDYLGRYTHRVGISNDRLESFENDEVTFTYLDRKAQPPMKKRLKVSGEEFARRFLQHTLPKNFYRIRYFGFLAGNVRAGCLERIRALLNLEEPGRVREASWQERLKELTGEDVDRCPRCKVGRMEFLRKLERVGGAERAPKEEKTSPGKASIDRIVLQAAAALRAAGAVRSKVSGRRQLLLFE
jgi:hypothetical protein